MSPDVPKMPVRASSSTRSLDVGECERARSRGKEMSRTYLLLVTAAAMIGLPAFGQMSTRRASITGGGGDTGKCTVEVRVDGAVEVEITGDMGRIRTLYGQPASWNRFDCSSPLPRNPVDFRFRGVDGRGNVQLIRDPSSRGATAVVRVE